MLLEATPSAHTGPTRRPVRLLALYTLSPRELSSSLELFAGLAERFLPRESCRHELPCFSEDAAPIQGPQKKRWPSGERQDRRWLRCGSSTIRSVVSRSSPRLALDDPARSQPRRKTPNSNLAVAVESGLLAAPETVEEAR